MVMHNFNMGNWLDKSIDYGIEIFINNSINFCNNISPINKEFYNMCTPLNYDEIKLITDEFIKSYKYPNITYINKPRPFFGQVYNINAICIEDVIDTFKHVIIKTNKEKQIRLHVIYRYKNSIEIEYSYI